MVGKEEEEKRGAARRGHRGILSSPVGVSVSGAFKWRSAAPGGDSEGGEAQGDGIGARVDPTEVAVPPDPSLGHDTFLCVRPSGFVFLQSRHPQRVHVTQRARRPSARLGLSPSSTAGPTTLPWLSFNSYRKKKGERF